MQKNAKILQRNAKICIKLQKMQQRWKNHRFFQKMENPLENRGISLENREKSAKNRTFWAPGGPPEALRRPPAAGRPGSPGPSGNFREIFAGPRFSRPTGRGLPIAQGTRAIFVPLAYQEQKKSGKKAGSRGRRAPSPRAGAFFGSQNPLFFSFTRLFLTGWN